jgi:putative transposase
LSITQQAQLLGMSRSSVYYLPRPTSQADLARMRVIDELYLELPFMGAGQLSRQLAKRGHKAGRLHVHTLMTQMGIEALAPQPSTSERNPQHRVYPYLLRKLCIVRSNQVWALDTPYIRMERGFVYLTAVVDVCSRRILAHRVALTLEAIHAKEVLQEALARHGAPEIVNTDRSAQFTAQEFVDVVFIVKAQPSLPATSTGTTVNAATSVMGGKHRMKFGSRTYPSSKRLRKMKVADMPRVGHRVGRCQVAMPAAVDHFASLQTHPHSLICRG